MHRVLVVDAGLQPINIISWSRAFVLLFAGEERARHDRDFRKPEVIRFSADGAVVGVETKLRIPSIIRLGRVIPSIRRRSKFCRKNVIVGRDRCVCQYCGSRLMTEDLNIDHVVPRAQGGKTTWENTVASCVPCNQRKANRTPEQAGMRLLRKPTRPTSLMDVAVRIDPAALPAEWRDYWDQALLP
jgi:hypothetical protein